jgi:chromosome segregation ATPase
MAPELQRTTVTRTTRTEGREDLKRNIAQIAEEIARVRDRAKEEAQSLERIRGMLDVGYLNDLLRTVETLETRLETVEQEAITAASDVDALRRELDAEQARLAKLWDAYKAQEDELARIKRDYPQLEERLADRERTIESLRREVARLEPLSRYKTDYETVVKENQALRTEVDHLEAELRRASDALRDLEHEATLLREDAASKTRVAELERQIEEERERLAKLYKVYEELEQDHKVSLERVGAWEEWFRSVQSGMRVVGNGADRAPRLRAA